MQYAWVAIREIGIESENLQRTVGWYRYSFINAKEVERLWRFLGCIYLFDCLHNE